MHDLLPGEAQRGQANHWRPHKPRKVTPEFVLRARSQDRSGKSCVAALVGVAWVRAGLPETPPTCVC